MLGWWFTVAVSDVRGEGWLHVQEYNRTAETFQMSPRSGENLWQQVSYQGPVSCVSWYSRVKSYHAVSCRNTAVAVKRADRCPFKYEHLPQ